MDFGLEESLVHVSPALKEVVGDGVGGHFHDGQQNHSLGQTWKGRHEKSRALCES